MAAQPSDADPAKPSWPTEAESKLTYAIAIVTGLIAKGELCKRVDWQAELRELLEELQAK